MTGHIIVPLCASIDVFGFRIMCTGPVDHLPRRVQAGRHNPASDVLAGHAAVAAEGAPRSLQILPAFELLRGYNVSMLQPACWQPLSTVSGALGVSVAAQVHNIVLIFQLGFRVFIRVQNTD